MMAVTPSDDEFRVNVSITRGQTVADQSPAVGIAPSGESLVVFAGRSPIEEAGVFARRFDANGAAIGGDFLVNVTTRGVQQQPSVDLADDGSFTVVWDGRGLGDHNGVFARRFNAEGAPLTGEILVNATTAGDQQFASVEHAPDGGFVVTWSGNGVGDFDGVFMRRFSSSGVALDSEQRANTATALEQAYSAVGVAPDGGFVIAWSSRHQDGSDWGVFAQRFDAGGRSTGGEFRVNQQNIGSQVRPSVAFDGAGNFVVAWNQIGDTLDSRDVIGRLFDATGSPVGDEFTVNSANPVQRGIQKDARVSMAADGSFFVTWTSGIADGSGWEVFGQSFTPEGLPDGVAVRINQKTAGLNSGHQELASAALSESGAGIVAWTGLGETDRVGVFTQAVAAAATTVAIEPILDRTIDELTLLNQPVVATAGPGDTLVYSFDRSPPGAQISSTTGAITWTPNEEQGVGVYPFTVVASVAGNPTRRAKETFIVTVREVNTAPSLSPIPNQPVVEQTELTFTATASDTDQPAQTLIFRLETGAPTGATIDPITGQFRWTPTEEQGPGDYPVTVRVNDLGSPDLSATRSFTITVQEANRAPVITEISDLEVEEVSQLVVALSAIDPDIPANTLTYRLDPGSPANAQINSQTGVITWTPTAEQAGQTFTFNVTVLDNGTPQRSDSDSFNATVKMLNDPPTLAAIADQAINEGQTFTLPVNATDPNGPSDTLTYSLDDGPATAQINSTNGAITWVTAEADGPKQFPFTVKVVDEAGLADTQTFVLTVREVNQPPVLAAIGDRQHPEQTPLSIDLSATDADLPANPLTYSLTTKPDGASIDGATGQIIWTPTEEQGPGVYTFTVTASDNQSPPATDSETFNITVQEVNRSPVVSDVPPQTIDLDQELVVTVTATDPDVPVNNLTFSFDGPAGFTSTGSTFRWIPTSVPATNPVTVTVTVSDNQSPALTDQTTFQITVNGERNPPQITAGLKTDTAPANTTNTDKITKDPTITGTVQDASPIAQFRAGFDGTPPASFVDVLSTRQANGSFELPVALVDQIAGGTLADGPHTLHLVATDNFGNASSVFDFTFTLDRTPPALVLTLAPAFDSAPTGDHTTIESVVNLTGTTDVGQTVAVASLGNFTGSASGQFEIIDVRLALASNPFQATAEDIAGNVTALNRTITREACEFDAVLNGWAAHEDGGGAAAGSVTSVDCAAVLREGDSFVVSLERVFTVPAGATTLSFTYADLNFDTTSTNAVRDAFEAALVDETGATLVTPFTPGRDAFYNFTEGVGEQKSAAATVVGSTVTLSLAGVPTDTRARLVFRLANNDSDTQTSVRITEFTLPDETAVLAPVVDTKFFVADPAADRVYGYSAAGVDQDTFLNAPADNTARGIAANVAGDTLWTVGTTGRVSVYAADGTRLGGWQTVGVTQPEGITVSGNNVWLVDAASDRVLQFAGATGRRIGSQVAATSNFALDAANASPSDLVTDGVNIWVTDDAADKVFVYTVAGALLGSWTLDAANVDPSGITLDPTPGSKTLWVSDRADRLVYRYAAGRDQTTGSVTATDSFALTAGNTQPEGIADPPGQTPAGDTLLDESYRAVLTTSSDFSLGTTFNANATDIPGSVSLNQASDTEFLPFIWIANSNEGTVSRFDVTTGKEIGRYRTGPNGGAHAPSRIAVSGDGSAWIANRAFGIQGSVVHVLLNGFVDRNGNGVADTSRDTNDNGTIEPEELIGWDENGDDLPDDERIALSVDVGRSDGNPEQLVADGVARAIAIDNSGNVWVGLFNLHQYEVYRTNGELLGIVATPDATPYGAVTDALGNLWGATLSGQISHINTSTLDFVRNVPVPGNTYGITVDDSGVVWTSPYPGATMVRFDPATDEVLGYDVPADSGGGITVDRQGAVWFAGYSTDRMWKFTFAPDRKTLIATDWVSTPGTPKAATIDSDGYLWTTTLNSNQAWKIDTQSNTVVPGWPVPTGDGPYNYSDMTGRLLPTRTGTWTEIIDSGRDGNAWAKVDFVTSTPDGTLAKVKIRASDERQSLPGTTAIEVTSGGLLSEIQGRFLEVLVELSSTVVDANPSLLRLAVESHRPPTIVVEEAPDKVVSPDTLVLAGAAMGASAEDASELSLERLPSGEGWQYNNSGNDAPEPSVFAVTGGVLTMNSLGVVDGSAANNVYERPGVDPRRPFTVTLRARVIGESGDTSRHKGFGFAVYTGTEVVLVSLGANSIQNPRLDNTETTLATGFDNTVFHDFRLDGVPGVGSRLYVDGAFVANVPHEATNLPNGIVLGDLSAANNSHVEVAAFRFSQPVANRIAQVVINDRPVDILDAAGNFFTKVNVLPGENVYQFTATDEFGQTATTSVTIQGTEPEPAVIDFSQFADVSASFKGVYGRTSWHREDRTLFVDLATRNDGTFETRVPLLVGVKNLSDPSVQLVGIDGVTPDGVPYHDFTDLIGHERFGPGQQSGFSPRLAFLNPTRQRFTYDLVFYGQLNDPPAFTSLPEVEAIVGKAYGYTLAASDPNGDPLSYSIVSAPAGVALSPTHELQWTPAATDVGSHDITVRVEDGRGGRADQHYVLGVIDPPVNRPPVFTTLPVTEVRIVARNEGPLQPLIGSPAGTTRVDYIRAGSNDGIANWSFDTAGSVLQTRNSDPGVLLFNDFRVVNKRVTGTVQINDTTDNDWVGIVFGYQDRDRFYILDWARSGEGDAPRLRVRVASGSMPVISPDTDAMKILAQRSTGWMPNRQYAFSLEFQSGRFSIRINDGSDVVFYETISDSTFTDGAFGFYNASQENVLYSGFAGQVVSPLSYRYDSEAVDPDRDVVSYALVDGPAGMAVNPTTGEVLWAPTAADLDPPALPIDPTLPIVPGFDVSVYANVPGAVRLAFDALGNLFTGRQPASGNNPGKVVRVAANSRAVQDIGSAALPDPDAVIVDSTGIVSGVPGAVLAGSGRDSSLEASIDAIWPDGSIHQLVHGNGTTEFSNPEDLAIDPSGRLLIADQNGSAGRVFVFSAGVASKLIELPNVDLLGLDVDDSGRIYLVASDGIIRVYEQNGNLVNGSFATGLGPLPSNIRFARGDGFTTGLVVIDSGGNLLRFDEAGQKAQVASGFPETFNSIAFGPDGSLFVSSYLDQPLNNRILRIAPSRETLGLHRGEHRVVLAASDGRGGVATQQYTICVTPEPANHSPIIVSEPVTVAAIDREYEVLSAWQQRDDYNLGIPEPEIEWQFPAGGSRATLNKNNSDPAVLLCPFDTSRGRFDGTLQVNTAGDDDDIGFVINFQDGGHFYLFKWGQGGDNNVPGMWVRKYASAEPLNRNDFSATIASTAHVTTLYRNMLPWDDFTEYEFSLTFNASGFSIVIIHAGQMVASIAIADTTYTSGRFGFYGHSQLQATFRLFEPSGSTYGYDVDALDPDRDTVTYSLVSGPEGMTIDSQSGLITWLPPLDAIVLSTTSVTIGDIDFFGFGTGTIGTPVPAVDFDNREPDDPVFTDVDLRRSQTGPDSDNDITWSHDLSAILAGRKVQELFVELAIGGIQDGNTALVGLNDRLYFEGIEVPVAFDMLNQGALGSAIVSFALTVDQIESLSIDGILDVSIEGGRSGPGSGVDTDFLDSYFIDAVRVEVKSTPRNEVTVRASDNRGGVDEQTFTISVAQGDAEIRGTIREGEQRIIESTFDSDLDGWSLPTGDIPGSWTWTETAGNPGGFATFLETGGAANPEGIALAPAKFLGDLHDFDGGLLSFDHRILATGAFDDRGPYEVLLQGPGGKAKWDGAIVPPMTTGWEHFEIPFSAGAWVVTEGTWNGILSNVSRLGIWLDVFQSTTAGESEGLDNVRLAAPLPPSLPNWSVYLDLNNNARLDTGEPTTTTDISGEYAFTGLPAGNYIVREVNQRGWEQTAPASKVHNVTLAASQVLTGIDFGNAQIPAGPNRAPVASASEAATATVGTLFRYNPLAADPENDPLTFDLVAAPLGMAVDPATGVVVWNPRADQVGVQQTVLRVRDVDSTGNFKDGVTLQPITITVALPNTAPVVTSTPPGPATVGLPYEYRITAQDADNDDWTVKLVDPALLGVALDEATGTLHWTPSGDQTPSVEVELLIDAAAGPDTPYTITLFAAASTTNRLPVILGAPKATARVGQQYQYLLEATDADGDPLSYAIATMPAGMTIGKNADGTTSPLPGLILWTPTAADLAQQDHNVVVSVSDGRGTPVTKSFSIHVVSQSANAPPRIVSTPPSRSIAAGNTYEYDLVVEDADRDPVLWTLEHGPAGMSLDAIRGTLRWTPGGDDVRTHEVIVRALDPLGEVARQRFVLDVSCVDLPPAIVSRPGTQAVKERRYTYGVRADDPENQRLEFSLATKPAGMMISPTGFIDWTPTAAQAGQTFTVVVEAKDPGGNVGRQTYSIAVASAPPNLPPVITSLPQTFASAGGVYQYTVAAFDPEGEAITFSLAETNKPAAMTLSGNTIEWPVPADLTGPQPKITVIATDAAGKQAQQAFEITVRANVPPVITPVADQEIKAGRTLRVDVKASDPGDRLTYSLDDASLARGMKIDSLGRIEWPVPASAVSDTSHPVMVTVTDSVGATVSDEFMVLVTADDTGPTVKIRMGTGGLAYEDPVRLSPGVLANFRVVATDDTGIASRSLELVDSAGTHTPLGLNAEGRADHLIADSGVYQVIASATDLSGNMAEVTRQLFVVDPADQNPPKITIISPTPNETVTNLIDVIGTIDDPEDQLLSWDVYVVRSDLADPANLDFSNPNFKKIGHGTTEVTAGKLATFDPTMLMNDGYTIWVVAYDATGQGFAEPVDVSVEGNTKLGQFRLEFTDLQIPVAGIPITITRVYDTRQASEKKDFGYGWSLGLRDGQIREAKAFGVGGALVGDNTFIPDVTKVYLTGPDGQRLGFTYKEEPAGGSLFGGYFKPSFKADSGNYYTLSIDEDTVVRGGAFGALIAGINPDDYTLTTPDGLKYRYNQFAGLQSITDLHGTVLTFQNDGVYSGGARVVTFLRDGQNRITKITYPFEQEDGTRTTEEIVYEYDAAGDLRVFRSQELLESKYRYKSAPAHYMDELIDPNGNRAVKLQYDEDGRLKSVTDANGNPVSYDYDVINNTETVHDANGNATKLTYDNMGNVTRDVLKDSAGNTLHDVSYEYGSAANPTKETKVTKLVSDGQGGMRAIVTSYKYDARGNTTEVTDPLGTRSFMYNDRGGVTEVKDELKRVSVFKYDGANNLMEVVNPAGSKSGITYDAQGRPLTYTDFRGAVTRFEYDGNGSQPSRIFNADHTAQNPSVKQFKYNAFGQVTESTSETGVVTRYQYDDQGRLIREQTGNDAPVIHVFQGQLETQRIVKRSEVNLALTDLVTQFGYYPDQKLKFEVDPADPEGHVTGYRYDKNGNRTMLARWATKADFDLENTGPMADPHLSFTHATFQHKFFYDGENRVDFELDDLQIFLADGDASYVPKKLDYDYDEAGNRTRITDRNDRVRTFEYDDRGRMRFERWFADSMDTTFDREIEYQYDAVGNLRFASDPDSTLTYTYDTLGRVKTVDNAGTPDMPQVILSYEYDANGNRIKVSDNLGVAVVSTYDVRNRLDTRGWVNTGATQAVDEVLVDFDYFSDGQQKELRRYTGTTATAANLVGRSAYGNADSAGRQRSIEHFVMRSGSEAKLTDYDYGFDETGLVKSLVYDNENDEHDFAVDYVYDKLGQLTDADYSAATTAKGVYVDEFYRYDDRGNRVDSYLHKKIAQPDGTSYETGRANRLTSDGTYSYEYDNEGNMVRKIELVSGQPTGQVTTFDYDYRNRLTRVTTYSTAPEDGGVILSESGYRYDAQGSRIEIVADADGAGTSPSQHTRMVYNNEHVWVDFDATNHVTVCYLYGDKVDQLLAHFQADVGPNTATAWPLSDRLNSVRDSVTADGGLHDSNSYSSFGIVLASVGSSAPGRFSFTGRELDEFSGQLHFRNREYDPPMGRFTTLDPVRFAAGDNNLYRYVGNTPTTATDPSGLGDIAESGIIASFIARQIATIQALGSAVAYAGFQWATAVQNWLRSGLFGNIVEDIKAVVHGGYYQTILYGGRDGAAAFYQRLTGLAAQGPRAIQQLQSLTVELYQSSSGFATVEITYSQPFIANGTKVVGETIRFVQ